jgi:AraC-like DNA-binding protein
VSVVFRAEGLPQGSHLDYWRDVLSNIFMPIDLLGEFGPHIPAEMRTAQLGPIRLNDSRTGAPFQTLRTSRLIRNSTPDVYLVGVLVDGQARIEQDNRQAVLRPGDLSLVDPARPSARSFTAMHTITVSIPKPMMPLRDRELTELTGVRVPGDHGASALASALTRQLAARINELSASQAARLSTAVADTLAVALAARIGNTSAAHEAREHILLHRIYAFIERQLSDPGLSPRSIAAAHHISLRTLHKLFEDESVSVGEWIRRRRLERCRQDLLDPALRDRPIAATAARWGLPNAAHFTRAFRAAYGAPPSEFRAQTPAATTTSHRADRNDR